jgi:hypothetical protein
MEVHGVTCHESSWKIKVRGRGEREESEKGGKDEIEYLDP